MISSSPLLLPVSSVGAAFYSCPNGLLNIGFEGAAGAIGDAIAAINRLLSCSNSAKLAYIWKDTPKEYSYRLSTW